MLIGVYLLVPETYHPVSVKSTFPLSTRHWRVLPRLLRRKAQKLRNQTTNAQLLAPSEKGSLPLRTIIVRSIYRPIMLLTMEPMCLNLCIYSAILLGILYLFFDAFQIVFSVCLRIRTMAAWTHIPWSLDRNDLCCSFWSVLATEIQPPWEISSGYNGGFWVLSRVETSSRYFLTFPFESQSLIYHLHCSYSRGAFGHYRSFRFLLDTISPRPLDCANYWKRLFWGRVRAQHLASTGKNVTDKTSWTISSSYSHSYYIEPFSFIPAYLHFLSMHTLGMPPVHWPRTVLLDRRSPVSSHCLVLRVSQNLESQHCVVAHTICP